MVGSRKITASVDRPIRKAGRRRTCRCRRQGLGFVPFLLSADLGDVDVKVADQIRLELRLGRPVTSHLLQSPDVLARPKGEEC
jgi:hypothetical protein